MLSRTGRRALAVVFFLVSGCSGGGGGDAASAPSGTTASGGPEPEERAWLERQRQLAQGGTEVAALPFAPVQAVDVLARYGGPSGAEVALDYPQSHRIQFLKGGAARVAIWDGTRFLTPVFTSVESRQGDRLCLARTRGWTGGCLTLSSNGQDFLCQFLWNNGASGEIGCRVTPIRQG